MKIILDFGISADGFIAKSDGDSDWVAVSTAPAFEARAKEMGCIVVGRRTYEQYRGEIYPMEGAINVVLSHTAQDEDDVRSAASPEEAVVIAEQYGCRGILIAGGGETAGAFLEADLINELFLTVHPLLLHQGIKPFGEVGREDRLELLASQQTHDGLVQLHYQILEN